MTGAWRAEQNNVDQWIQADFRVIRRLISIATLADRNTGHRVTLYTISYSLTNHYWLQLDTLFDGNSDDVWMQTNFLPGSVVARYIRLHPLTWHGSISLLWDVTWCRVDGKWYHIALIYALISELWYCYITYAKKKQK